MQTLKQFVDTWNGKQLWFNGYDQCVAVAERYGLDVLGYPPVWANAIDWYGKDTTFLTWTANSPTNMPDEGDVITWHQNYKAGTGIYGHIAVVVGPSCGYPAPTVMEFYSFDQNWGTGALALCRVVKHTYDGVTGWADKIIAPDPAAIAAAKAAADAAAAKLAADAAAKSAADAAAKAAADAQAAQVAAQALADAAAKAAAEQAARAAQAAADAKDAAEAKVAADAALAAHKTALGRAPIVALVIAALAALVLALVRKISGR